MGLENINKAKTYILPLLKVDEIKKIHIIRDNIFYNHKKLFFHCPPKYIVRNAILKTIYKFIASLVLIKKNKIDVIYGIQMFPHGLMAWLISRISHKKFIFAVISGGAEVASRGNFIKKFTSKVLQESDYLLMEGIKENFSKKIKYPKFITELNISKNAILPGYCSCFVENFFPLKIEKKWDIITVAGLHKVKRLDLFIKIVEEVSKKRKIKCAIIGDGSQYSYLKNLVENKRLQDNIRFLGEIPNEKLNDYYNQSKIFLLTSESEGLPATLIEAMLAEMCVISTDVGSISNLIENNFNGFLYKFNEIINSTQLILQLLDDEDYYKQIAKNGRITALSYSAWNRVQVWREIIDNFNKK